METIFNSSNSLVNLLKRLFVVCALASAPLFALDSSEKPCPFCNDEIIQKQLIFEGKTNVILYSLTPITKGNVLIISKRHITRFEEMADEEMAEVQQMIRKLAPIFQKAYGVSDYFIMQKNGVNAGQSLEHVHFHIFPCPVHLSKLVAKAIIYSPALTDQEMKECCDELRPYFED